MHRCTYYDRLEVKNGKITRIVTAHFKDEKLEVYKHNEDGRNYCRNVVLSNMNGYGIIFPNESMGFYYGNEPMKLDPYTLVRGDSHCKNGEKILPLYCMNYPSYEDLELVTSFYPEFKYVIKKHKFNSNRELVLALTIWKKHKEIEYLLEKDWKTIAYSKAFFKLTDKKKKQFIKFARTNGNLINKYQLSVRDIFQIIKKNIDSNFIETYLYYKYDCKCEDLELIKYFEKKSYNTYSDVSTYKDYIKLASNCGHDTEDSYWKFPSDLHKAHNKVMNEWQNIKTMRDREKNKEKQKLYLNSVKKFLKYNNMNFEGYQIFVPDNIEDIAKQAKLLNQCLIACDYVSKVICKQCILVFIRDLFGNPVATTEILPNKKIGQFYADESDYSNCTPSDELKEIFNSWLSDSKINIRKNNREKLSA